MVVLRRANCTEEPVMPKVKRPKSAPLVLISSNSVVSGGVLIYRHSVTSQWMLILSVCTCRALASRKLN